MFETRFAVPRRLTGFRGVCGGLGLCHRSPTARRPGFLNDPGPRADTYGGARRVLH